MRIQIVLEYKGDYKHQRIAFQFNGNSLGSHLTVSQAKAMAKIYRQWQCQWGTPASGSANVNAMDNTKKPSYEHAHKTFNY